VQPISFGRILGETGKLEKGAGGEFTSQPAGFNRKNAVWAPLIFRLKSL
jgi:hypothetical protein